jgi:phosphatidyl-myo-inositol alpha-mannosyltransferase
VKIGIVCPYSWDTPGGVQFHVRDLAAHLIGLGHDVSVLAPADDDTPLPPYVVSAGRAVPVPYNGSVARVNFGFLSAARVRRWLHDGAFDVLHVHEPGTPSLSLLACWNASGPIVATFHTANQRSRAMTATYPILQPAFEKINARIAVSEYARRTLVEHIGGDAVVIPNGVDVSYFAKAEPKPEWSGSTRSTGSTSTTGSTGSTSTTGTTIGFLGRFEEPRKGLPVLLEAFPAIVGKLPDTRLLIAGPGDPAEITRTLPASVRGNVTFLGMISDPDRASFLRSVDLYCAPNTGGESFGIILVEAMSAAVPVLASDIDAFSLVLAGGTAGRMFPNGDAAALADAAVTLLTDPEQRAGLSAAGSVAVRRYDWSVVAADILSIYEMVTESTAQVTTDSWNESAKARGRR